jgi:hypothetical protein
VIAEHHLDMLTASGITPEHAAARGYETISDPRRLAELRIVKDGRRTRGLLVPQLRRDGSTWGYQYRPDHPRERKGKVVKYETPWQQRNGIDVPPGVGDSLDDPAVPLWITEGVKKADAGALQGLCIVALPGVWSWLGRNNSGGKTAVPDFHDIALNGRRVILAFDGDVARKAAVGKALNALADYLRSKGANVEYLHLPDTDDKTGLDDYLADHPVEDLWRLVKPVQPTITKSARNTPRTTPQPRNRARHKRCPRLRGCHASSTPWPMKCSTAAWSARNSWREPCTLYRPRGCSTSRYPPVSKAIPRRASHTPSKPWPGSFHLRLTLNSRPCPNAR